MNVLSEPYDILICFFHAPGAIDLRLDKQELVGNKILKVNSLCGSDTMDVSVGRQFPTSCKMPEFSEKSLFSGAGKHPDFQVTLCLRFVTTNVNFAYIESE